MRCPNCGFEIDDYEGCCLSCKHYGCDGYGSEYCKSEERYEEWKKSKHTFGAFNTFFDPKYDGIECKYYKHDD